jgi:hypothetical protein
MDPSGKTMSTAWGPAGLENLRSFALHDHSTIATSTGMDSVPPATSVKQTLALEYDREYHKIFGEFCFP